MPALTLLSGPVLLTLRATSYTNRYKRTNEIADLNLAIETYQIAKDTCSKGHPQRAHVLLEYGLALQSRYTTLKGSDDLDLAIQQFRAALEICPGDLVITARRSLAFALDLRYRQQHDDNDIDLAIQSYASVIDLLPQDQLDSLLACMGYALVLRMRFHRRGLLDDLNLAIHYFDMVVRRCPLGNVHHATALVFYAELLIIRAEQRESLVDIESAIEYFRTGMNVRPEGDPSRPYLLGSLGYALLARFVHSGDAIDLERAIESCYDAVLSQPSGNDEARAVSINYLAITLFSRYQLQGDKMDAARARTYFQQALDLCPPGHTYRTGVLNNYARLLGRLSEDGVSGPDDLELCIRYFYEALGLCFEPSRSAILHNLAMVLLFRFSRQGDPSDIDIASSLCQIALELRPEGHPYRPMTFLVQAKTVTKRLTLNSDVEEAFKYRISAAEQSSGGSRSQFEAAMKWVEDAEKFSHPSVLHAYRSAIRLLDLHLVLKPSVDLRHDIIKKEALSLCADATSCALRHQDVVGAVEMFEQSRGLFWSHISRLRTPLDTLRASGQDNQDLADKFESLSRQLDMPMTLGDEEEAQRYRRVQREWNAVANRIRAVNGFSDFLLPLSYSDLQAAATGGPIIILNASRHSCDAIIVLAHDIPIHISFPENTFARVLAILSEFEKSLRFLRRITDSPRGEEERKREQRHLAGLLRRLWDIIVRDVVRSLEPHVPKNSRIWWCPTGPFTSLPLHAATPYRKGELGLSDLYVSSYTPTLSALIRSRDKVTTLRGTPLSFVSIGQPNSSGHDELLTVRKELDLVHELLPEAIQFTELSDENATRDAALAALKTHTFAHLACHGRQVPGYPFDSHFEMHDGPLSLLHIIHSNLGHETEFAFLSACQTATGDNDAPDEVIHLAAALQFSGVRNVVGTMRSVDDSIVVHIVGAFYRAMIGDNGEFDPSRAARALRVATTCRGTRDNVPLDQRIIFIHIGA
ncbi:hypothetical protein BS17DRAFT_809162 [Gyrodon lividus]|nr:hypothetical protein BS17DRAFT_809162 [Gyrodon lividus]